jgi:hypothetical protein
MLPSGALRGRSAPEFEWNRAVSEAQLGDANLVKSVVFPPGVAAIGERALSYFKALESVVFPTGYGDLGLPRLQSFAGAEGRFAPRRG